MYPRLIHEVGDSAIGVRVCFRFHIRILRPAALLDLQNIRKPKIVLKLLARAYMIPRLFLPGIFPTSAMYDIRKALKMFRFILFLK